jgi:hypothetical protein
MSLEHLEYVDRALELVDEAREQGLELRILGSLAYRLHCPANIALFERMKRDLTDIDFAGRGAQRKQVRSFLESRGFVIDQDMLVTTEGKRYFFSDPATGTGVDVFFDELFFCHPIPLRDRLVLDYPTITTADLLLEKMQIVELNPKDIKDTIVLVFEHPLGPGEREAIDVAYIAKLLADDWGFYYTVSRNLEAVRDGLREYDAVNATEASVIRQRLDELQQAIEAEPKTRRWKLRARIGPRVKWYQEVAEKSATY